MLKFCSCGYLMTGDICTNKNCSMHKALPRKAGNPGAGKAADKMAAKPSMKAKPPYDRARRSSRCITYSIKELENKPDK